MLCLFWSGWNAPRHNNDLWGTIPLASAVASQTKRTLSKVIHMLIYPLLIHCLIERQGRVADSTSSVALILAVCWTRKGFICTTKYFVWYIFRNNSYTLCMYWYMVSVQLTDTESDLCLHIHLTRHPVTRSPLSQNSQQEMMPED
jgi:hypothetical protein